MAAVGSSDTALRVWAAFKQLQASELLSSGLVVASQILIIVRTGRNQCPLKLGQALLGFCLP